eukprot:Skav235659  [mRNA]  locus=scaffold358:836760:837632:+ [translate_table: standard]
MAFLKHKYESSGKKLLFLNYDETNVMYTPDCPQGCIVAKRHWKSKHPGYPHRRVQPEKRRATLTYCAIICDLPAAQAAVPHFVLASSARMSKQCARAYCSLKPRTKLHLLRRKSAWVTAEALVFMLKTLRASLAPWIPEYKPILLLDAAGAHLPKNIFTTARKLGIQLVFCPASSTALVQPLDVFGFGPFKMWLKRKYQEERQSETDGQPQLLAWLYHLSQAPQHFFSARKWRRSFAAIGAGEVHQLHSRLAEFMQFPASFPPSVKPTAAEFSVVWPKRRKMSYAYASLF